MWQSNIARIKENLERLHQLSQDGDGVALEKAAAQADFPEDFFRHIYFTASTYFHQRHFAKAQSLFAFLCFFHRERPFLWQAFGLSLMRGAKFAWAESAFTVAETLDPADPRNYYYRGLCFIQSGDKVLACEQFELAVKYSNNNRSQYSNIHKKSLCILAEMEKE